jgi:hydrogenase expression/formation protein HypE
MKTSQQNLTPNPLFRQVKQMRRKRGKVREPIVTLAHGSGGSAMRDLIDDIFVSSFDNPTLALLEDQARLDLASLMALGDRLAFTTDSFVVDPLFFPGGDMGTLAVNGTVNDLAVSGAKPIYLSCSVILEEGLPVETLRKIARSMKVAAANAGIEIVTGDTKVVPRGSADKLFINTAGLGVIRAGISAAAQQIKPGDVIMVNGFLGNHGAAILMARGELALTSEIESDCQPLNGLIEAMLEACPEIHAMRDATRGGLAAVLNEFAASAGVGIRLQEPAIPIQEEVAGLCELLGLDPLYLANEGKLVAAVPRSQADAVLAAMQAHPAGRDSCIIGEAIDTPAGMVMLKTAFGTERIVGTLVGDQLPRIC